MGGGKVILETIQVARHVGKLGLRPVQKAAQQAAVVGEDCAIWAIKLQPVQELLGRRQAAALLDSYFQVKEVVTESVASLSQQSLNSALQTGAQYATQGLNYGGVKARVVGPHDEHWNTMKVIKSLCTAEKERMTSSAQSVVQLTPKRFVQFMREAERKRRRTRQRDPVEEYVETILQSTAISSMGPPQLEKKLYTDVARIISYAFDRALFEANGTDVWGHALNIQACRDPVEHGRGSPWRQQRTGISVEPVEALVDRVLTSKELEVPVFMAGMQRQLLVNCSVMVLHLIEDLTSDRHMQLNVLGHGLHVTLEPLPLSQLQEDGASVGHAEQFHVNTSAVDELVEALLAEPEFQLVLLPDVVEAEIYRLALHRMICIAQFMLSQIRMSLFGSEVRFSLAIAEDAGGDAAQDDPATEEAGGPGSAAFSHVHVVDKDLQIHIGRLDAERRGIERELRRRRNTEELDAHEEPMALAGEGPEVHHEFEAMALQDRLSRSLKIQRVVAVPIEVAYKLVSDVAEYPRWMPFCTTARVLSRPRERGAILCEVGFGLATGTVLGTVGDVIRYSVTLSPPIATSHEDPLRAARVVADTPEGFSWGRRLVYDWRFQEVAPGQTDVKLDIFYQARAQFYVPLWDSMQAMLTSTMVQKFVERADAIGDAQSNSEAADEVPGVAAARDAAGPSPQGQSPSATSSSVTHLQQLP